MGRETPATGRDGSPVGAVVGPWVGDSVGDDVAVAVAVDVDVDVAVEVDVDVAKTMVSKLQDLVDVFPAAGWHVPVASAVGALFVPSEYIHSSPAGQAVPAIPPQAVPAAAGLLLGAVGATDSCLRL